MTGASRLAPVISMLHALPFSNLEEEKYWCLACFLLP